MKTMMVLAFALACATPVVADSGYYSITITGPSGESCTVQAIKGRPFDHNAAVRYCNEWIKSHRPAHAPGEPRTRGCGAATSENKCTTERTPQ